MTEKKSSGLFRCLVYNGGVSLTLINGGVMCSDGIELQGFAGEQAKIFGGALLGTAFLGGLLKDKRGEVSVVLKTDGTIENLTASVNAALSVRACMDCHEAAAGTADSFYGTGGFLQVVRDDGYSRPFVGACALCNNETGDAEEFFAANFEEYFTVSEQLPTRFAFYLGGGCDYFLAALQALPGCGKNWEVSAKDKLAAVLNEYRCGKSAAESATSVFGEISCEEERDLRYRCNCSAEYLKGVLSTLGKDELESILQEQGAVKIHCRYCNKDYAFTRTDLADLLSRLGK